MSSDAGKAVLAVLAARDNIRLILEWTADRDFEALKGDTLIRYAVERAFIAIGASLKDIPSRLLQEHGIPSKIIAGFRNLLAHTYDDVLDDRVMPTIRNDLPALDSALVAILVVLRDGEHA